MTYYYDVPEWRGQTKIIVAMEQPPKGYEFDAFVLEDKPHFKGKTVIDNVEYDTRCWKFLPYPLGCIIGIRDGRVQHTPTQIIRRVSAVAVKQVKELTGAEYYQAYHNDSLRSSRDERLMDVVGSVLKIHPDWTSETWVEVVDITPEWK